MSLILHLKCFKLIFNFPKKNCLFLYVMPNFINYTPCFLIIIVRCNSSLSTPRSTCTCRRNLCVFIYHFCHGFWASFGNRASIELFFALICWHVHLNVCNLTNCTFCWTVICLLQLLGAHIHVSLCCTAGIHNYSQQKVANFSIPTGRLTDWPDNSCLLF